MKCRKNLSNPNVKDCMQCEYQDLCKMEPPPRPAPAPFDQRKRSLIFTQKAQKVS